MRQRFPYGDEGIARSVYDSIVSCLAQEDWSALHATASLVDADKRMDLAAPHGLSDHSKQQRLDDLSHPLPVLRRGLKRQSQPMNEMTLSSAASRGFHTGHAWTQISR